MLAHWNSLPRSVPFASHPNADRPHNDQRVIHGQSGSNRIKLLRCILTHPFPVGPTRRTTWTCQQAFVGDDYPGDIPQRIKSAEIRLEFMNEWLPRQLGDGDEFTGSAHQLFAANKWAQIQPSGLTVPFRSVSRPKPIWQRQKPKIQFRGEHLAPFYALSSTPRNPLK